MDFFAGWIPSLNMGKKYVYYTFILYCVYYKIRMFFSDILPFHMQKCDPKFSLVCIFKAYYLQEDT